MWGFGGSGQEKKELIFVGIAILILLAIVVPYGMRAIEKAQLAKMHADFKSIKAAFLSLYVDVGVFPVTQTSGYGNSNDGDIEPRLGETDLIHPVLFPDSRGWNGPYIRRVPQPPFGGSYRYGNCPRCYAIGIGFRIKANVNYPLKGTNLNKKKMTDIAERLDDMIDGRPDFEAGKLMYRKSKRIFYRID